MKGLADRFLTSLGLARSLVVYYGQPWRRSALRRFYGSIVKPGDLVFDIGAHVGSRSSTLLSLGTNVVAVEPQPAVAAEDDTQPLRASNDPRRRPQPKREVVIESRVLETPMSGPLNTDLPPPIALVATPVERPANDPRARKRDGSAAEVREEVVGSNDNGSA